MKAGHLRSFGHRVRAFVREDGGVSAIEFAIAAPVVFLLVIATVELGAYMMIDATVQMAAQAASRAGLINVAPANGMDREDAAKAAAMSVLGAWTTMANTTVTISEVDYGNYSNVGTTKSTSGAGGFGDVVSYNITLTKSTLTGLPGLFGVSQMVFSRNFLVQNEK